MTMHKRFILWALVGLLPCALSACASQGVAPGLDCAHATHGAEKAICQTPALSALDRQLNSVYQQALDKTENLGIGATKAADDLKADQASWLKSIDDCWKAGDQQGCIRENYMQRISNLEAAWALKAPYATVAFTCTDNSTFTLTFYNTTLLPAVVIARGRAHEVWLETRTASGAKYAGDFGSYVWLKGTTARFVWDKGQPALACHTQG